MERQLESGKPKARAKVQQILEFWKVGRELARVRGPGQLPGEEQEACAALWAEVDALDKSVRTAATGSRC